MIFFLKMRSRIVGTIFFLLMIGLFCLFWSGCATPIRPPAGQKPIEKTLMVTGYCKCGLCCGWERNWYGRAVYSYGPLKGKPKKVGQTASGKMARRGTIAADTSRYPFGTVMYIPGYGYGVVEDTGGDIKGDHIDLFFSSHSKADRWGVKKIKVKIWLPSSPKKSQGTRK